MVALRLHEKILGKNDFRLEKKILDSKKKISTTFVHYGLLYLFYFAKRNEMKPNKKKPGEI